MSTAARWSPPNPDPSLTLLCSRHRLARVWLGALPTPSMDVRTVAERRLLPPRPRAPGNETVAVELALPRGGKTGFGAVGGRLTSEPGARELRVVLPDDAVGCQYRDSLASFSDYVRTGFPPRYSDALFAGIAARVLAEGAPAGTLQVTWAAHGRIGSDAAIFRLLGGLLVELMLAPAGALDEAGLTRLLDAPWIDGH